MERVIIKGGRLVDPASGIDGVYNIYVMGGRVASVKKAETDTSEIVPGSPGLEVIDAEGLLVMPGLIDLHTHLREPGYEYKEDISTGSRAAAAGGFTTILCMANTNPVNDNGSVTRYILKKAEEGSGVNIRPVGAISMGLKGERLTEFGELKEAGCVAVSDDGVPVVNSALMRRALEYSAVFGLTVITHAEEPGLATGVMNEGAVATRLGLKGTPNAAEDSMVARDIALAALTGGRLHIAHVSTKGAVELVRDAKKRGLKVTAEATPHHLALTDTAVERYDTNAKMNPPLRSVEDRDALIEGIIDGTIDSIATDHAPHSTIEKDVEFDKASNGIIGLETAFSVVYGLVKAGRLTLNDAVRALTINPSRALNLNRGTLRVGSSADVTIADLNRSWKVTPEVLKSKSKNSPWIGSTLDGVVVRTIVGGRTVYDAAR
ncbi:MAG TPA: dihydroorotase [Thermodesulfobacteriota bacterium]|nr:dihydroorotase [Thermodesulfobacteriota bacterium]